jgi:hypothetical protein
MSTLWTPDGERPVRRAPADTPTEPDGAAAPPSAGAAPRRREPASPEGADDEQMAAQLDELREQLARTPAALVVANHAFGLFELAALHLSLQPPQLDEARVAIDALAALVEGMAGRLGDNEAQLRDGLAQLRMAFVQIRSAQEQR